MSEQKSCAFRTSIGGQALIEGILMRGPEKQAIVVRDQEGQLVEKVEELRLIKDRYPILGVPLIRGTVNFLSAMVNGVRALMYSADFYPDEEAFVREHADFVTNFRESFADICRRYRVEVPVSEIAYVHAYIRGMAGAQGAPTGGDAGADE